MLKARGGQVPNAPEEDTEYKAFVQAACDGQILVGVDRIFARKLYTELSASKLRKNRQKPRLAKLVVWFWRPRREP